MESVNTIDEIDIRATSNGVAAGTTDQTTTAVDVRDGTDITHVAHIGTITATGVPEVILQYSLDGTNYVDHTASKVVYTDADSNKLAVISVPYVPPTWVRTRLKITRGVANAVIVAAWAILSKGRRIQPLGRTGASPLHSTVKGQNKAIVDA